jgi:hypothetical protein
MPPMSTSTSPNRSQRLGACRATTALVCLSAALAGAGCDDVTIDLFNADLGLVGHWTLDESVPGTTVADSSGFDHPGTPSASPPAPTSLVPPVRFTDRGSLSFNGVDQWVQLGNPDLLNFGGPLTLAAWVRLDDGAANHNIVSHGYRLAPDQEVALRAYAGKYQFLWWDGIDHGAALPIPASDIGTWVHLCGVFDGSTYFLYRNGALVATTADANAPMRFDATWAIGGRPPVDADPPYRLMQGAIDDVRIYGRALAPGEVDALYRR